jgi:hypothetical protein
VLGTALFHLAATGVPVLLDADLADFHAEAAHRGRFRRLRLSSHKPTKIARPITCSHSRPASRWAAPMFGVIAPGHQHRIASFW